MAVPPMPQRGARGAVPRGAFFAALALGLAALAAALLVFVRPSTETLLEPVFFQIAAKDVPAPGDDPLRVGRGRFFLVNLRAGEGTHGLHGFPGEGGLLALSWRDPHRGCTTTWRGDFLFEARQGWFRTPCHGELYTKAGVPCFLPFAAWTDNVRRRRPGRRAGDRKHGRRHAGRGRQPHARRRLPAPLTHRPLVPRPHHRRPQNSTGVRLAKRYRRAGRCRPALAVCCVPTSRSDASIRRRKFRLSSLRPRIDS